MTNILRKAKKLREQNIETKNKQGHNNKLNNPFYLVQFTNYLVI